MKRILGIGNALVDIMTLLEGDYILQEFNLPKGSMQLVDREKSEGIKSATRFFPRKLSSGGSAANTIHGLAMLGADTGFIGSIGRDETGDFFENDMKKAGVNTLLIRRNSVTGTAVALISADTERTFATHLGAAVELTASDLKPMLFEGYDILYLEGYLINDKQLVETACRFARENGMQIALDLASYNVVQAHLDSFKKIVKDYVDILFANEQESWEFTGLEPEKALPEMAKLCEIVILKTGAEGSWIKRGNETIRVSAFPVKCVDTTGAGDLYAAGFLYGLSMGSGLEFCGTIGSLMAGKVIEIVGARMDVEKFSEIITEIASLAGNK
ncbi:MAG: adenosine kinase [Bacteroidales bacterium]|nr:adenosine kinase [Bacteroidales bacterium]